MGGGSGGSGSELADPFGPLCPSLSGGRGGGQWVMVRALWDFSLCVHVSFCMWSFPQAAE